MLKPTPVYAKGVRPPGGLEEEAFLAACIHCGRCAAVCDQRAIDMDMHGLPAINGLTGWCDFCMLCVDACPTNALQRTNSENPVLGMALIDRKRCIAWNYPGCRLCYEGCLELQQAIWLDDRYRPYIDVSRCNGCGLCVFVCPQSAEEERDKRFGKAVALIANDDNARNSAQIET